MTLGAAAAFPRENYGLDLAVLGSIISSYGVLQLNVFMNPIGAMQVWTFSNLILLAWSIGLWRKWWDGGLAGLALVCMYSFFTLANVWGLTHV